MLHGPMKINYLSLATPFNRMTKHSESISLNFLFLIIPFLYKAWYAALQCSALHTKTTTSISKKIARYLLSTKSSHNFFWTCTEREDRLNEYLFAQFFSTTFILCTKMILFATFSYKSR